MNRRCLALLFLLGLAQLDLGKLDLSFQFPLKWLELSIGLALSRVQQVVLTFCGKGDTHHGTLTSPYVKRTTKKELPQLLLVFQEWLERILQQSTISLMPLSS
jgi:hypothetical protein